MSENRCMGCMRGLDADVSVCPHCGFDRTQYVQPENALSPGSLMGDGKYQVGRVLGQGGLSITYIALYETLDVRVAIKEYMPKGRACRTGDSTSVNWSVGMEEQKSGRESFIKEAQKMAQTGDTPGVVPVRDIFYQNGTAYIVTDYAEGETLESYVQKHGPMDVKSCFQLLKPVMEALEVLHERRIIYRNVTPDRIMLDKRNRPWLLPPIMCGRKETTFHPLMPPRYSPFLALEHYADGARIGPWTDVYAMCATFYYCMSGQAPHPAIERVLKPHCLDAPNGASLALMMVLKRGLFPNPKKRIQTITELCGQLEAAVNGREFLKQSFAYFLSFPPKPNFSGVRRAIRRNEKIFSAVIITLWALLSLLALALIVNASLS